MVGAVSKLVSIVIPCRNGADHIGRLIDELRALEAPAGWASEIVVGYQDSRDGTLEILKEKGVTVAPCEAEGPGPARNAAVALSRGELICFMDADARPADRGFLVRVVRAAERLGEFGGLGGPILLDPAQAWNPIALGDHFACWFNWSAKRPSGETTLFQPCANFIMRRAVFERAGGFDRQFRVLQDFELQERIQRLGLPLHFDNTLRVYHHARGTLSSSWSHSWWWGRPYRETYIKTKQADSWFFVQSERFFWVNLPAILLRRLRYVTVRALRVSPAKTLYSLPFLVMTVFAWALGVAFGTGQPPPEAETPERLGG